MSDDPRVRDLLDKLFDHTVTPEEVCVACPELLPVVQTRWQQICRVRVELDALLPVRSGNDFDEGSSNNQQLPNIPGYEVDEVLGHGGMGIVFRAKQVKLNRLVALKMTLSGSYINACERERFRREAEAIAALRHANVIQVYDFGDIAGRPFFTMELIEGGSLAQRQKEQGTPLPARQTAALLATLAEAVHAAHQGGIVHRDLKPANILFTADGTPKITDFGLSQRLEGSPELTLSGVPLGTPSYMAPEQARGQLREIGPTADVYALGAILYEMLTGRPPFRGETPADTLLQVVQDEPVPPTRLNRKTPRDLQTICLTCLKKEPRHRYVTAAALADDLQRFLRGEAIAARPEIYWMHWVRRAWRQPLLSTAILIAVLSSLAFAAGGLWLYSDQSARTQAAYDDVREMSRYLHASSWSAARAARNRANDRLRGTAPAHLRQVIEQGTRDLELAALLETFHTQGIEAIAGEAALVNYDREFMDAFQAAGLGTGDERPDIVAERVKQSDIREALVSSLDWHAVVMLNSNRRRGQWSLAVARLADADQSDWRLRARDMEVLDDTAATKALMDARPATDTSPIPFPTLEVYLSNKQLPLAERVALLRKVYQARPDDFWMNMRLGCFLHGNQANAEGLGYLQVATALRPESAIAHHHFGNSLWEARRHEEALAQYLRAAELDPSIEGYSRFYVRGLTAINRYDEAREYLQGLLLDNPRSAFAHLELGRISEQEGQEAEALALLTKAVKLDPTHLNSQKALREYWLNRGRLNELQSAWQKMLPDQVADYSAWYGYGELCLFLDQKDEYLRARRVLLKQFGETTNPRTAEQVSRLSLLLPAEGAEMAVAVELSQRALAIDAVQNRGFRPYFLFSRGLVEYRQGRFEAAMATLKGDAARVLGPAPRLVLAMALHQSGRKQEALQTLAAVMTAHDWRASLCRGQDAWIFHVLRREAEGLILPRLPEFLAGTYQPQDNVERLAYIGSCQFADRSLALAQIYHDVLAAAPSMPESANEYRYAAARAAARTASGLGSDASGLSETERGSWRRQAIDWLRLELDSCIKTLSHCDDKTQRQILQRLKQWQTEQDLAGLREPGSTEPDVQDVCRKLWADVQAVLARFPGRS